MPVPSTSTGTARGKGRRRGRAAKGRQVEDDALRTMPRGGRPVHVWVCDIPEAAGTHPGVLLGWQQAPRGRWLGRVMMAAEGREGWVTMTLWVDARNLRSLDARP